MARLQYNIKENMSRNNISAENRLNLMSVEQINFYKLKKKTWVLSSALLAQAALTPQPAPPAVLSIVLSEKGIWLNIASENEEEHLNEKELEKIRLQKVPCRLISNQNLNKILIFFTQEYRENALKRLQRSKVFWIGMKLGKLWYIQCTSGKSY